MSVLTPARTTTAAKGGQADGTPAAAKAPATGMGMGDDLWDSDEEVEGTGIGMSPPKTMQFHVPASRLVRTPGKSRPEAPLCEGCGADTCGVAREASKRIVEDLLMTAGMEDGLEEAEEEGSPSIVKTGGLLEEDTF